MENTTQGTHSGSQAATTQSLALFADTVNEAWQACSPLVSVVVLMDLGDELNAQVAERDRIVVLNRTDRSAVRTLVAHLDLTTSLTGTLVEGLGQIARQILGQIAEGIDALNVIQQPPDSNTKNN